MDQADRTLPRHAMRPQRYGVALGALLIATLPWVALYQEPHAHAAPAPEIEYLYNVQVRRHYGFPADTDPVGYGHKTCDKVSRGESYAQVMGDVKHDVIPNDEAAANYLVSYAVNLLCPEQIWQLRNSAADYQVPTG